MAGQLQHANSAERAEATRPVEFTVICAVAFIASVAATGYFCRSMCCEMEMPGGWTMSMMWMRVPGQTWIASASSFLFMWLAIARLVGISAIIAGVSYLLRGLPASKLTF